MAADINRAIIDIQRNGGTADCVQMSEGSLLYRVIAANGKVVVEGVTKDTAETIIQQAKNRVIID